MTTNNGAMDANKGLAQGGLTLVEFMMAVAILGIVVAMALPGYRGNLFRAKAVEVVEATQAVKTALGQLQVENGPTIGDGLIIATAPDRDPPLESRLREQPGSPRAVSGISAADLNFPRHGLRIAVSSGVGLAQTPGLYTIRIYWNPALPGAAQSRQVALAAHDALRHEAVDAWIGSSHVGLLMSLDNAPVAPGRGRQN